MSNQPIIFKDSQGSANTTITTNPTNNNRDIRLIQPLTNNNPLLNQIATNNNNTQMNFSSVPMTRRNYTYMANVTIPSVTHIIAPANQPHLPIMNNNNNVSLKLPRVLPPPNSSYYSNTTITTAPAPAAITSATNSSGVLSSSSSSGSSGVGTPKTNQRRETLLSVSDASSPVYKRDSNSASLPPFKSFDSSRRHSVSLAILDDPVQQLRNSQQPTLGAIVKDENNNFIVPLVQVQQPGMSEPSSIKTELEIGLPDEENIHKVGERYNDKGELIGRSGKILRDTKRAAQNRCAQKAFRIRREKYIKNLELKSKQFDRMVNENSKLKSRIKELEKLL